jgi:preprotein translocase subunit SecG
MLSGFLLVVLVLVCIAMAVVILLQRSEGGALGMGGGPSGFMTARGAGDLLTRTTSILAGAFFVLCLVLTLIAGRSHQGGSVVDRLKVNGLTPEALGRARSAAPAAAPTPPPSTPGGSAADIGVVQPPSSSFEAPKPQVHTAPAVSPTPAPPTAADNGANRRSSNIAGVQTAPQSTPTVAPLAKPFPNQPSVAAPPAAEKPPAASASGNTTGGQ